MTVEDKKNLPAHVRNAVEQGIIHSQSAEYFSPYTDSDLTAFLKAFGGLRLSSQAQREFAEWVGEIASRDETGIPEVLALPAVAHVLSSSNLNPPQKIAKVRESLFALRFPVYAATLDMWHTLARRSNPDPARIVFTPDPGFEKDRLEVKVTLTKGSQAKELFAKLSVLPEEIWDELVHPKQKTVKAG